MLNEKNGIFTCTWEIVNFLCNNNDELQSPIFVVKSLSGSSWVLRLVKINSVYSCYLRRKEGREALEKSTINFSLKIFSFDGNLLYGKDFEDEVFTKEQSMGVINFITAEKLVNEIKSSTEDTLTIQCIMTLPEAAAAAEPVRSECEIQTIIDVDRCLLSLNVKSSDFSYCLENSSFTAVDMPLFKIALNVPNEQVEITINILNDCFLRRLVAFRFTFINSRNEILDSKCEVHTFESQTVWKFPSFITKKQIKGVGKEWFDFLIKCEISVPMNTITYSKIKNYICESSCIAELHPVKESSNTSLKQNLRSLLYNQTYSDVKLKVQGEEIAAHKAILGSRSPVFAAMFNQDMLENKTGIVDISDIKKEIIKLFLEFMYTETVENLNCEYALELIVVAEKYQVVSLKDECLSHLMSGLSLENACDILSVSDLVNHETLKLRALNFIKNNASEILTSSEWLQWVENNFKLASEFFAYLSVELAATSRKLGR